MNQQSNTANDFTHIDLFSGIGGFSLAAESAGFKTILFCEIDEFCQKVLQERFGGIVADSEHPRGIEAEGIGENSCNQSKSKTGKGVFINESQRENCIRREDVRRRSIPIIPDIRNIDGTKFRGATLLTGGFPCQPFSVAGQRRGKDDDRHLWPEMLRVITEAKPCWIIGENVAGIVRMELDQVLADLENTGYSTQAVIIPACAKNAPHRRDRVWVIANSQTQRTQGDRAERKQEPSSYAREKISLCNDSRNATDSPCIGSRGVRNEGQEKGPRCSDKLSGIPNRIPWDTPWIEVATTFCRVDDGISPGIHADRVKRLKALGNAIVPQVAQEIIKCIYRIENDNQT